MLTGAKGTVNDAILIDDPGASFGDRMLTASLISAAFAATIVTGFAREQDCAGSPSAPSMSPGTKFLSTPTRSPPRCASFWEISIKKSL